MSILKQDLKAPSTSVKPSRITFWKMLPTRFETSIDIAWRIAHTFPLWLMRFTSHGQEILSVCLHFLEVDKVKFETINQRNMKFCWISPFFRESIAQGTLSVLKTFWKNVAIRSCRRQPYDTTSSVSSSDVGVQAHFKRVAPDADYGINAAACIVGMYKSSQIPAIRIMFDSCQQAFIFL